MSERDSESESGILGTLIPSALRRRYVYKITVPLFVVMLVMTAIGGVGYIQAQSTVKENTRNQMESMAVLHAESTGDWVDGLREQTLEISSHESATSGGYASRRDYINLNRKNFHPGVWQIHYVDTADNTVKFSTLIDYRNSSFESVDEPWADTSFYDGLDAHTQVLISNESVETTGLKPVVVLFATPVLGSGGEYVVVVATLGRQVDGLHQPVPQGETALYSQSSGEVLVGAENYSIPAELQGLEDGTNAVFVEGDRRVFAATRVQGTDWVSITSAPKAAMFETANTVGQFMLIIMIAGIVGLLMVGAVIGHQTSRPLRQLRDKAQAMEDGDLDVPFDTGRIDEIGQLYSGFGSMRDALREQIEEAEQARKEAEVSRAEAMEMNEYLQDKAEEYSEIMQACTRGDLTRRMEAERGNEAMNRIAREFNEMIQELEMTTGQLKTFAVEVEEGGRGVQESAETLRDASEQMAESVQRISDDAYEQYEQLQTISEEMDTVADRLKSLADEHPDVAVEEPLDTITEIAALIDEVASLGEAAMNESESVAGAAEEQAAELNEVSSRAEELVRTARYLSDGLRNFETEAEHEFVFQTGAVSDQPGRGGDGSGDDSARE